MNKVLPSKWIRKAIYAAVNNIVVSGKTIECFDSRVSGNNIPDHYILMSSQANDVIKANKCEDSWDSSILIDVFTSYTGTNGGGSRDLAESIIDKVRDVTKALVLDASSNLVIVWQKQSFPNDMVSITDNQSVYRKLMRIDFYVN